MIDPQRAFAAASMLVDLGWKAAVIADRQHGAEVAAILGPNPVLSDIVELVEQLERLGWPSTLEVTKQGQLRLRLLEPLAEFLGIPELEA